MRLGWLGIFVAMFIVACEIPALADGPGKTELNKNADGTWQLLRDGKPYLIKGGGGGGSKTVLAQCGGNSFRTWGVGRETQADLDEAQKLGLTVSLGIWLGHKDNGFNYSNAAQVEKQKEEVKKAVLKYKDAPALLLWSLGNEMEAAGNDTPELWNAIEDLAKMVHELDPAHPTMTVVAELGGHHLDNINKYCPDIDIIGINSYGGGPSLAERYKKGGGVKPFVITEFGPPGTWELKMNAFGAAPELTSTQKADRYRETYVKSVLGAPGLCLGSYAFTWGYKIEATSTWYGMFLPDGSKLASVDALTELWSGKPPANPCPVIKTLALDGKDQLNSGDIVKAHVDVASPTGEPLKIQWMLFREQKTYNVQGTGVDATPSFPEAIEKNGESTVSMKMPPNGGIYRIYCYIRDGKGSAAVGSIPLSVKGPKTRAKAPVAEIPLVVYGDDQKNAPYVASGWMGNVGSLTMDPECADNPHSGKTCLKFDYQKKDGWAGVVWQSPANDWGEKPGGLDLSAAEKVTFWARGAKGGEKIKCGIGMIGIEKKYHDSAKVESDNITLTTEWKQYTIDLSERDLSCIKSGFFWILHGQGEPVTFFFDDIQYE